MAPRTCQVPECGAPLSPILVAAGRHCCNPCLWRKDPTAIADYEFAIGASPPAALTTPTQETPMPRVNCAECGLRLGQADRKAGRKYHEHCAPTTGPVEADSSPDTQTEPANAAGIYTQKQYDEAQDDAFERGRASVHVDLEMRAKALWWDGKSDLAEALRLVVRGIPS